MRRRRGPLRVPVVPDDGDLVVDARVRARLLGLHLLDLDARVVAHTAREEPRRATPRGSAETVRQGPRSDGADVGSLGRPALSRAERLLEEGASALGDARLMRRQSRVSADGAIARRRASGGRRATLSR